MIKLNPGVLRLTKYVVPFVGLVPVAFGISLGLEKLAPEKAQAALGETPAIQSSAQPVASSASRMALIIGNADYPDANAPLSHPVKDARALADQLRRNGFEVDVQENLGKDELKRAFDNFNARIKPGTVALVSYGGFGIQVGRQSYMIPVNAQIWKEADVRRDGVSIESVLADMHSRGANVKVAIFDASRRNPFERRFRALSAGLAAIDTPQGTLLMSAAAPGKVAYDADAEHSLLIGELLKEIGAPGMSAEGVFNHTRIGVSRASNGEQVPLVASSLVENFAFVPGTPRYASTKPVDAVDTRIAPPAEATDVVIGQGSDTLYPPKATARPVQAKPPKQGETEYQLASQPATVEKKEPKTPKAVEEVKRPRTLNELGRAIKQEQPRTIFGRGLWHSSSINCHRKVRVAALAPQHAFPSPMVGVAY
jgi:hypothetical protein